MKFLIDAQLPPFLVRLIQEAGHEAIHVADIGMSSSEDTIIWNYAASNSMVILTKDEDFAARIQLRPEILGVVWLRIGNCSNRALFTWFTSILPHVLKCLQQGDKLVEIL